LSASERRVRRIWAEILDRSAGSIPIDQAFLSLGGTSLKAVQVLSGIEEEEFGLRLNQDILIECHTVREMAAYLDRHLKAGIKPLVHRKTTERSASLAPGADTEIAIIGMACRFPGAESPAQYWDNLLNKVDSIREVPSDRWAMDRYYQPGNNPSPGKTNSRWGGFIDNPYDFDADFFHVSPEEATGMDPQQRLFLAVAYETMESAGYAGVQSEGRTVGLFVGASHNNYLEHHLHTLGLMDLEEFQSFVSLPEAQRHALRTEWKGRYGVTELHPNTAVDNLLNMIAARTSHTLNLKGPSLTIDTACSSSLVAVHLACESLRRGECEMALAGGVSLLLTPTPYLLFARAGALSPSGRCKVFDADADGFVPGEGVGTVLLKPLRRALEDGDNVSAVIKGSAVNNDGRSLGVMAPNPDGQRAVIESLYRKHAIHVRDIQYIEAHGTGTAIGDPSEVRASRGHSPSLVTATRAACSDR